MKSETTETAVTITAPQMAALTPVVRDSAPLAHDEVAGRTVASLISSGTEVTGLYQGSSPLPTVPGYAAVFRVEEVGEGVTDLCKGDLAFCSGPHRSFQRMPQDHVLRLPDGLAAEVAVFARLMSVSMSTLTTTTVRPPQKVLVTGLGPVGNLAAQVFARCGYHILACDPQQARRDDASRAGLGHVYPTVPVDDPSVAGQVALVVECSGHEQAVLDGCRVVRKKGEVVLTGVPWHRRSELYAQELLSAVFHNYVVLRSGWEWEVPLHPTDFRHGSIMANSAAALRWLAEGQVSVVGLYTLASPRNAQQVYQDILHQRSSTMATVFDWREVSAST